MNKKLSAASFFSQIVVKQIQILLSASRELAKLRLVFYVKGNCLLLTSTYLTHHKKRLNFLHLKASLQQNLKLFRHGKNV